MLCRWDGPCRKVKTTKKSTTKKKTKKSTTKKKKTTSKPNHHQSSIRVASINIWEGSGKNVLKKLTKQIKGMDVVALQEVPDKPWPNIRGFSTVYWQGPSEHDKMGMLVSDKSEWRPTGVTRRVRSKLCDTKRDVYVTTFVHSRTKKKLTVANVHLCGGRYDESVHHNTKSISGLVKIKTETILKKPADIILGDFNSDVHHFITGKPLASQEKYLKGLGWTAARIKAWNTAPYMKLEKAGYSLVPPAKKTSVYGTTPDTIWAKDLFLVSHGVLPMGAASDHDGLYATFSA